MITRGLQRRGWHGTHCCVWLLARYSPCLRRRCRRRSGFKTGGEICDRGSTRDLGRVIRPCRDSKDFRRPHTRPVQVMGLSVRKGPAPLQCCSPLCAMRKLTLYPRGDIIISFSWRAHQYHPPGGDKYVLVWMAYWPQEGGIDKY